jgi:hypothetical protein
VATIGRTADDGRTTTTSSGFVLGTVVAGRYSGG